MSDDTSSVEERDLDAEIDELAIKIEKSLQKAKERNEKWEGTFDPKYRRMEEADPVELFS